MTSLLDTAAELHGTHLKRAEIALNVSPPRLDLFWLHSRICDVVSTALEELRALPKTQDVSPVPETQKPEAELPPETQS